jgi:hypothetical protein
VREGPLARTPAADHPLLSDALLHISLASLNAGQAAWSASSDQTMLLPTSPMLALNEHHISSHHVDVLLCAGLRILPPLFDHHMAQR